MHVWVPIMRRLSWPRSGELFTRDGRAVSDAELHAEILDNAEADLEIARAAIERAIKSGLDLELARALYARGRED